MKKENKYTIILLFDTPALQNDIKKFRLQELKRIHEDIIIGDLSSVLKPLVDESVTAQRINSKDFKKIIFKNKKEIKKFISLHTDNCFYFPMFDDYYEVRYIYYLFVKYNIKYGYINNLNPDVADAGIPKVQISTSKLNAKHIKQGIYNRIIRKLNCFCPASLYFYANDLSRDHYFWRGNCSERKTKKIGVHSFDYDNFMASEVSKEQNYAVYLDVYSPYHPDMIGTDWDIDPQKYFENMNGIFDEIERKTGCKVLIAAHPRADYNNKIYSFKKENIYYGQTIELVKGANFLIGSWSTTNQMAVMANKPLVIVCEDEIWRNQRYRKICMHQAAFFGSKMIRNKCDIKDLDFRINQNIYEDIRKKYWCVDNAIKPDLWKKIIYQVDSEMV